MSAIIWLPEHSLALPFFGIEVKTDLFQSCGHCWVFQICWYVECRTLIASSFRIWNSSAGLPSPPLALFIVMLPKAHLTLHSRKNMNICTEKLSLVFYFQIEFFLFLVFIFNIWILPTQGLNPGLLHCRRILYQLSHKRSPRILEWIACPFSSRFSQPRNWTRVSSIIAGRFLTNWAIREVP